MKYPHKAQRNIKMRKILVLGAGKSSPALIRYLIDNSAKEDWYITIMDNSTKHISPEIHKHLRTKIITGDIQKERKRKQIMTDSDLVISLLPPRFHAIIAKECLNLKKHFLTASYVSPEIKQLDPDVKQLGLIFLNEVGLDPGIDHMSAMRLINKVKKQGKQILGFESFTGGLIAPECERDNPWRYKFTWNPRNVVLAGQGPPAKFIQNNRFKYIPYHKLFRRTELIEIDGLGKFEGYANRDSLKYMDLYGLNDISTFFRGTLRRKGFCRAWDMFIQLGLTDDSFILENSKDMTNKEFINSFLAYNPHDSVKLKTQHYLQLDYDSDLIDKLEWLDLFKDIKIGQKNATPAQMLQRILEKKWSLKPQDKDMIVMLHLLDTTLNNQIKRHQSVMVVKGEDQTYTAMAKTVGLPLAIAAKNILNGFIRAPGVQLPLQKNIYDPILKELDTFDIQFKEQIVKIPE